MTEDRSGVVAVLATLDTKEWQAAVVVDELVRRDVSVVLIDAGGAERATPMLLGELRAPARVVGRAEVASAGEMPEGSAGRAERVAALGRGAAAVVEAMLARGELRGLLALGGGTGAAIAAESLRVLPFGLPKMLVSTGVTGDVEQTAGDTDVILVQPAVDLVGRSPLLETVLRRSAAALAATVDCLLQVRPADRPRVGVTAFGVTTPAAEEVVRLLAERGADAIVFHARGSGGRSLERLAAEGGLDALIDLTTTEIVDEVAGGARSAGPGRLDAVVASGIPVVVVPGALDVLNFGAPATVPERFAGRPTIAHSETTTLVRSSPEDNARAAVFIASKIRSANSPRIAVLVPDGGFSALDAPAAAFWSPVADRAFADTIVAHLAELAERVPVRHSAWHINDPEFAREAVDLLVSLAPDLLSPAPAPKGHAS